MSCLSVYLRFFFSALFSLLFLLILQSSREHLLLRSSPVSSPARQSSPSSGGSMQVKRDTELTVAPGPPPAKRLLSDEDSPPEKNAPPTLGTHIKISNRGNGNDRSSSYFLPPSLSLSLLPAQRDSWLLYFPGDGRNGDNSLVVSMELNGVMYQGVLFAQSDSRSTSSTASTANNKPSRSVVS